MEKTNGSNKVKVVLFKAKAVGKKAWQQLRLAVREMGNALTNVLVPILSVACAMAEVLQLPTGAVAKLKQAEHKLFFACETMEIIHTYLGRMEQAVQQKQKEESV